MSTEQNSKTPEATGEYTQNQDHDISPNVFMTISIAVNNAISPIFVTARSGDLAMLMVISFG